MFFIATPVVREIKVWVDMRKRIGRSPRSWVTLATLLVLAGFAFFPMTSRIQVPAVLDDARQQAIYPAVDGRLTEVYVTEGQTVKAGDPLFSFDDPELPLRIAQARQRIILDETRLRAGAGDEVERASRVVIERQIEQGRESLSALKDRETELLVRAPLDGVVRDLIPYLEPGTWFGRKQFLGRVIDHGSPVARGFIRESDLMRLDQSATGRFIADDLRIPKLPLSSVTFADFSITRLPDGYLAAINGGDIPVLKDERGELRPQGVWYPVDAQAADTGTVGMPTLRTVQTGVITLQRQPESLVTRAVRRIARVLIREADL